MHSGLVEHDEAGTELFTLGIYTGITPLANQYLYALVTLLLPPVFLLVLAAILFERRDLRSNRELAPCCEAQIGFLRSLLEWARTEGAAPLRDEILEAIAEILDTGRFVGGDACKNFETAMAQLVSSALRSAQSWMRTTSPSSLAFAVPVTRITFAKRCLF